MHVVYKPLSLPFFTIIHFLHWDARFSLSKQPFSSLFIYFKRNKRKIKEHDVLDNCMYPITEDRRSTKSYSKFILCVLCLQYIVA